VKNHDLTSQPSARRILFEHRPVLDRSGEPVDGLHNVWVVLNNPD
jgi:hypothetical protein